MWLVASMNNYNLKYATEIAPDMEKNNVWMTIDGREVDVVTCKTLYQATAVCSSIIIFLEEGVDFAMLTKDGDDIILSAMTGVLSIRVHPNGESTREGFTCSSCGAAHEPEILIPSLDTNLVEEDEEVENPDDDDYEGED